MVEFIASDRSLFFTKNDPNDPRLGEMAKPKPLENGKTEVTIVGYPDDEGIKLNGGREGASQGPTAIRQSLYRTTPHPSLPLFNFYDRGDLKVGGLLAERHEQARQAVQEELGLGRRVLALGGGNDYAFSDGMAFLEHFKNQQPLIINVDAHLDVRNTNNGFNSGTPFYRLLESDIKFDFVELGIQSHCNAKAHWDYVVGKGGKIITTEEILESSQSLQSYCIEELGELVLRRRPTYLSIDIDAFAWPYAVGSSAAWPMGIDPHAFWPLFVTLLRRLQVAVMGIYEVSPKLETGIGTSKLAAQLAHRFLHNNHV